MLMCLLVLGLLVYLAVKLVPAMIVVTLAAFVLRKLRFWFR